MITKNNGSIVIEVENSTERVNAKNLIKEKLSEEYEIRIPTSLYPNILRTGISFEYDDTRLLELIKKQNQCMNNTNVKIIKQYEIRKNNRTYYNAIAEVEPKDCQYFNRGKNYHWLGTLEGVRRNQVITMF